MTALDYLGRPEALRREIAREKDRIESLRELCTRVSARLRKVTVRSSPDPARMQDLIARIADGEQELRRLEEDLRQALADTALYISSLPDERMIRVLGPQLGTNVPGHGLLPRRRFPLSAGSAPPASPAPGRPGGNFCLTPKISLDSFPFSGIMVSDETK